MENKRKEFNKLTNETIKNQEDSKKRNSDAALFREEKRIQDDTNRLLKSEILKDDTNFVDAYSNTPSSAKISKSRSLSLTNSTYSTKLLEKLVQGQTDNEFTRATLAYQESSLKLLEEIKQTISELKPKEMEKENKEDDSLEREVSSLANSIAQLDIPSLYKELKRTSIRMFDKTGITDTFAMLYEMMAGTMGDRSEMVNMFKGKIKNGVLNKAFGKNMAQMINKFEEDPMEMIQDFINMKANSSNQFFRTLFGKHASAIEIKKASDRRADAEEFKALNDKLTYNTINYRLPESLDRIEAAITGNVKRSYDYATNRYLTDEERMRDFIGSGKHFDLKSASEQLLDDLKESLSDLFDNGSISKDILKEYLVFDNSKNELKRGADNRYIFRDELAMNDLLLQIHKSKVDLTMMYDNNFSAENFLRNNNIKLSKGISKQQQINAANTLHQILMNNGYNPMKDFSESLDDNKRSASNIDIMDTHYAMFTPEQIALAKSFREGEISYDTFKTLLEESGLSKSSNNSKRRISRISRTSDDFKKSFKYRMYNSNVVHEDMNDPEKKMKDIEEYQKRSKNGSDVVYNGSKSLKDDEHLNKLRLLLNNNLRDSNYYKNLFNTDIESSSGFKINDFMKKNIDEDMIKFEKATELYTKFLNAKMTPQTLSATTGQSYDYFKNAGYPTCPADLFKYIKINEQGEAEVDYDSLSKLNTQFSKEYVEALSKRYKIDTKGIDMDITDPGKTTSNILNEMFRDPTVLKSMGVKSGGAAGFFLGKMLQSKGVITSPLAPYLMGGLGAAIMNMESVQNRMNMILGPEGDIKGKSGFTNREIAMAKFMNKTLPRIGLGGLVAKNFYKMFAGSGALGTGIGIIGGGTLGLLTAAIAPSLMKFGREKLFGDDGEGNKGVLKSIGGLLRNIPWVEKYLSLNIKKEDSNDMLVSYAAADLEREVEDRIKELEETAPKDTNGNFMNPEDKILHDTLLEFGKNLKYNKERLLKDKSGSLARDKNESDEAYINRVQKYVTEKVVKLAEKKSSNELVDEKKQLIIQQVESIASGFKTNLDEKIMRRDALSNIEGDLADLDYDKDVGKRSLDKTIMGIANNQKRKEAMEFFKEVEEADGKDFYDKMINTIITRVDEDGSRKEKAREFKRFMDITRTENADEALSVLLGDERIKLLREGKIDEFKDSFYETVKDKDGKDVRKLKEDDELFELFETISELGSLSEDYLSQDEINMIRSMALIKARSLSKNPDDPSVYTRADEITRSILNKLNKKTLGDKIDDSTRSTIGKIKEAFAKLTGDVGVMDGEDAEKEKEVFSLFRKYNIMNSDFIKEGLDRKAKRDQADLDDKINNNPTEGSGSGSEVSTKMYNLKKYKFKNGKTLDLTGCSVASLNNMLISLDLGAINIEELIKIANNHLSDNGAVKDSFFDEMTQRLGLTLKVYNKDTTKFSKSFFKSIKPSSKRGVIILKDNPNLPYGHFILMKSISGNNIIIDDPELRGIKTYSFADLISLSNSVYVFEKENEMIESKEVRTIKKRIKDRTGIDLNRSIIDNVKEFLKPKNKNSEIPTISNTSLDDTASNTPTGNDTITSLLEKIYDYISNGILNIRIVDDVMMPLKVSDGSMSKVLGDGRNRVNISDPTALTKFYDKMRLNPVSKEEFAKADAVQDAIINGTGLGTGAGSLAIDKKPETSESEIKKMGGIGGIIGGLIGDGLGLIGEGAGLVGGWKLLKSKLFKTAAKEGTEEVVEQTTKKGIKGFISKFFRKKGKDKVIQEMTEKTLKETGEQGVKFLPKVANTMKSFFATIFEKSPRILKRYTGKLVKTVSPFIDNFISAFGKFMKSSKSLIEKKLAKNTAKGIGMKVPYLNVAIGIGTFLWAFYDGYKNANELIGSNEDLNILTKLAIGFAKGVAIALPGLVLSSVNGFVGAAFEIYMELHGFKALVQWFLESNDESKNSKLKSQETKNNLEDINKEEINSEDKVTQQTKSSASIAEIAKTMENTTPDNKSSDGSGDLSLPDELNIDNKSKSFITKEDKAKYNSLTKDYEKHLENEKFKKSSGMGVIEKLVLNNFKANGAYSHPLGDPNRTITSVFGPRNYTGASKNHKGIDFAGNRGDSVYAVAAGTVIYADDRWGFVRIKHPDGTSSGYMHMDSIGVKVGDQVLPGQVIGTVGGKGRTKSGSFSRTAYSPHLHFDFQNKTKDGEDPFSNGNKVDPFPVLGLDPNVIKLAPKNKALENINYLSKHKNLLSQLNDDNKATYDKSTAKGGPDDPIVNSTNLLTNVIGELNTNIKGLNINNNSSSSDITALASTELIKLMVQMNQSIQSLIQITANQSAILERVVTTINGLKIDPSDIRAANMSRIGTF